MSDVPANAPNDKPLANALESVTAADVSRADVALPHPPQRPWRGRWLRAVWWLLPVLALLMSLSLAALWWAAHRPGPSAWLLRQVPGVAVVAPEGALLGDFKAQRLSWQGRAGQSLSIEMPQWRGLTLAWDAAQRWRVSAHLVALEAQAVRWQSVPVPPDRPAQPRQAPSSLGIPLAVQIDQLKVGSLWVSELGAEPLTGVAGSLALQRRGTHHLRLSSLRWQAWQVSGALSVGVSGDMPVQAQWQARSSQGSLNLRLHGPLARLESQADVQVELAASDAGGARPPAQRLGAQVQWLPFAAWPVARAEVSASRFDLSRLVRQWPVTALSGQVRVQPRQRLPGMPGAQVLAPRPTGAAGKVAGEPLADDLVAQLDVRNDSPGAWDAARLPLRRVQADITLPAQAQVQALADLGRAGQIEAQLALPSLAGRSDGRMLVSGRWSLAQPQSTALSLDLRGGDLRALHGQAPALWLQGRAQVQGQADQAWRLTGELGSQAGGAAALPTAVQATWDARWTPEALIVRTLQLRAGAAQALLSGQWQGAGWRAEVASGPTPPANPLNAAPRPQQIEARAQFTAFDPAVWLPWPRPAGDAAQATRLDGEMNLALTQTRPSAKLGPATGALAAWQGQARGSLSRSVLLGVPLTATWDAQGNLPSPKASASGEVNGLGGLNGAIEDKKTNAVGGERASPWRAQLALLAGANKVRLALDGPRAGPATRQLSPHWLGAQVQAEVDAPDLSAWRAWGEALGLRSLGGRLQLSGRWQALSEPAGRADQSASSGAPGPSGSSGAASLAWPASWQSTGQFTADGLRWDMGGAQPVLVQGARVQWALGTGAVSVAAAPATTATSATSATPTLAQNALTGEVARAQWGGWTLQQTQLNISGPWRNQRLSLSTRADLPERQASGGEKVKESVRAELVWQGAWQGAPSWQGATAWQGKVQTLLVQPLTVQPAPPWLAVQPFDLNWVPAASPQAGGGHWQLSPTRATVMGAQLALRTLRWAPNTPHGELDLALDLEPLKVADVLQRWQPRAGWGGDLSVGGQLRARRLAGQPWEVDAKMARLNGDLSLSEQAFDGANVQRLGMRQAIIELQARGGVWTLREQLDGRVLGQLTGQQVVQVADPRALPGPGSALSGQLALTVGNLRAMGVWAPPGWRLSGQLAGQATLSGTLGQPRYNGRLTGQQLGLGNALLGVQLSDGDLALSLNGGRATLEYFQARGSSGEPVAATSAASAATVAAGATRAMLPEVTGPGGRLRITGEAEMVGDAATGPRAVLRLQADRFGLLRRVDRQAVVTGDMQIRLDAEAIAADGQIKVDSGLVDLSQSDAPTVGDDVVVSNRPDADPQEAAGATSGRKRKLNVNLALDLGQQLRLKGRGIDTRLGGTLRLTTPGGRPQVQGSVATREGNYAAYGQKLLIERGSLAFTGPVENPRLDILAMRAPSRTAMDSDVKVGVRITGTAQDPRVRLYSEPAMSETEKLSWLVLGRGPVGLGGADIGLLQTAATALWAGEGAAPQDTLISAIGLDDLSVRQSDGAVRDTIVSLGKQISSRWYLGYERSLNATEGSWQAIYRLAQRFTLRAQLGDDNALDLIWSWRWN